MGCDIIQIPQRIRSNKPERRPRAAACYWSKVCLANCMALPKNPCTLIRRQSRPRHKLAAATRGASSLAESPALLFADACAQSCRKHGCGRLPRRLPSAVVSGRRKAVLESHCPPATRAAKHHRLQAAGPYTVLRRGALPAQRIDHGHRMHLPQPDNRAASAPKKAAAPCDTRRNAKDQPAASPSPGRPPVDNWTGRSAPRGLPS